MSYRVLIFDDQKEIRQLLWSLFDDRGYEVFTFPHPAICPLAEADCCPCPPDQSCTDIIISDVDMPILNGLDFIEQQIGKGCRCKYIALMSGAFTDEQIAKATALGITLFRKPFRITDIINWLDRIEKEIDPRRELTDWYLSVGSKDKGRG